MRSGAIFIAGLTALLGFRRRAGGAEQQQQQEQNAPTTLASRPTRRLPSDDQLANALTFDPATLAAGAPSADTAPAAAVRAQGSRRQPNGS